MSIDYLCNSMHLSTNSQKTPLFIILSLALIITQLKAQNDSLRPIKYSFNGYAETYYLMDFNQTKNEVRPSFYVSHHRQNEFNLQIGMLRFAAENKRIKTSLAFMAGSYVNANLAHEPDLLKNIYEAQLSLKLSPKKELWLQAGVFNSHIGFESAIGADCYTLSRSIAADNSPYYESGVRLNYRSKNTHWELNFLILNGWQRIQRLKNNHMPSFGTQVIYNTSKITFNSSNYFGNEGTDQLPVWRYYQNFYLITTLASKSKLITGVDVGLQHNSAKSKLIYWWSPQLIYQYQCTKSFNVAGRIEYFYDKNGAITSPLNHTALNVIGLSVNVDYKIINNVLFRIEFKELNNNDPIFMKKKTLSRYNSSATAAFTVKF